MSNVTDVTQYTIEVNMGQVENSGGSLTLYAADGFTDAMVTAIYEALANLTWPQAVRPGSNIGVSKSDQASTNYATDYNTNPPAFA